MRLFSLYVLVLLVKIYWQIIEHQVMRKILM